MKMIYYKNIAMVLSIGILLMVAVISFGFSLKKVNPMLLDGEVMKTIYLKGDKVVLDCSYEDFSSHYHITLHFYLYGRNFSVNPSSPSIVASNPNIIVVPICKESKNYKKSDQIHSFYSIPTFRKTTFFSHEYDVIFRDSVRPDSISLFIPPTDFLIHNSVTVITDTITIEKRRGESL